MSQQKLRRPDGGFKTIHGFAVMVEGHYRGWQIRRHWGGFQGFRTIDGGAEVTTSVFPFRRQVEKAINAFEEKYPT